MAQAARQSNFGYPVQGRGPFGLARRVLGRVLWPLVRQQIEFNRGIGEVLSQLNVEVGSLREHALSFQRAIDNFENAFDNVDEAFVDFDRRERLIGERLDLVVRQSFIRYHEGVGVLQKELAELSQRLQRDLDERARTSSESERAFRDTLRRVEVGLSEVRYRVGEVDLFLNEVKRAMPQSPSPERLAALPGALANLYPSFEEVMRGSESEIMDRVRPYLDDVATVKVKGQVLDLGSGRCEWLELLKNSGVDAYGVDINEQYVAQGVAKGFDVRHEDVIEHLKGLPESELKAITAIHLVEHLDTETLLEVLDLSLRALRPGGLLILETPDPENLIVGASSFYLDPTHLHPIPPPLLSFLVTARGFTDVIVRKLKRSELIEPELPPDAPWREDVERLWEFLQTQVMGPEDFAVLARRA